MKLYKVAYEIPKSGVADRTVPAEDWVVDDNRIVHVGPLSFPLHSLVSIEEMGDAPLCGCQRCDDGIRYCLADAEGEALASS